MNDDKSMIEYKEKKGIGEWFKAKIQKIKDMFRRLGKREETGFHEVSIEELYKDLGVDPNGAKSWSLTPEQKEIANDRSDEGVKPVEDNLEKEYDR